MDYLDIVEVDSIDDAVTWLSDDDEYVGVITAIQLTGTGHGVNSNELRRVADSMDLMCCGIGEGVFRIDGNLWFVACDYGH